MHSQCSGLRVGHFEANTRSEPQICGKCIGGAISPWSSPAARDFLDGGIKIEGRLRVGDQCDHGKSGASSSQSSFALWPILSGVLFAMIGPGLLIGYIERWRIVDALYFTFVTGLTIGYGDLTPRHVVSRLLAVVIGLAGIMLTGLVAAVSVQALQVTAPASRDRNTPLAELAELPSSGPRSFQDRKEGKK